MSVSESADYSSDSSSPSTPRPNQRRPPPPLPHGNGSDESLGDQPLSLTQPRLPGVSSHAHRPPPTPSASTGVQSSMRTYQDRHEDYDAQRQERLAQYRKRRLTNSEDYVRRRQNPDQLRSNQSSSSRDLPLPLLPPSPARPEHRNRPQPEVIDLTGSSPPTSPTRHRRPSRNSSSSSRRYVVPPWQPDGEVNECPVCKRPFTWLFRRHHCRKCGRVVCSECSPHRITIPRQFIVQPPGLENSSSPVEDRANPETIDLTPDDDQDFDRNMPRHLSTRKPSMNSTFLDTGEKVRLCNPCVPDPQPDPFPNFPPFNGAIFAHQDFLGPLPALRQHQAIEPRTVQIPGANSRHTNPGSTSSLPTAEPFSRPHPDRSRHSSINNYPGPYPFAARHRPLIPDHGNMMGATLNNHPLPPLPGNLRPPHPAYGHHRFSSLDSRGGMSHDLSSGQRGSSMMEGPPRHFPSNYPGPATPFDLIRSSRPRIHERDACPVCRRALPARGADGDETEREAHIMACITARDPSATGTPGDQGSSSSGRVHMLSFTASEKDCVGEDGNVQECSICMVEYDVGDQLSRLECFCKFHKECIVSWLNRKAECPVHKASNFNS